MNQQKTFLHLPSTGARIHRDHIVGVLPSRFDTHEGSVDGYLVTLSRQIFGLSSRFSGFEIKDPADVAAVKGWIEGQP